MGRRSLAEKIYEETEGIAEEEGAWLVIYDFHGIKPSTKYWTNLKRLVKITGGGSLIQYSVFHTREKRAAATVSRLARHYGGTSSVYRVEMVENL